MPSFSRASSMMGRLVASCAIWMSVFGLVCCDAGIGRFLPKLRFYFPRLLMFLSPLGERLGEGVQYEDRLLHHPLTRPLPHGGEEEERRGTKETRRVITPAERRRRAWRQPPIRRR